jgi:hypothetical protein
MFLMNYLVCCGAICQLFLWGNEKELFYIQLVKLLYFPLKAYYLNFCNAEVMDIRWEWEWEYISLVSYIAK